MINSWSLIIDQQISYMINKFTIKFVDHVWYLLINDQWSTVDQRPWSLIMLWSTVDHMLWSLIIAMISCWSYAMIIDHSYEEAVDHTWCITLSCHDESYRDHYARVVQLPYYSPCWLLLEIVIQLWVMLNSNLESKLVNQTCQIVFRSARTS